MFIIIVIHGTIQVGKPIIPSLVFPLFFGTISVVNWSLSSSVREHLTHIIREGLLILEG
jgi:hypothetical protein